MLQVEQKNKRNLLLFNKLRFAYSALGRIQTLNPQSRNLVFYPVELRVHFTAFAVESRKSKGNLPILKLPDDQI